jgi:hypothetical protein
MDALCELRTWPAFNPSNTRTVERNGLRILVGLPCQVRRLGILRAFRFWGLQPPRRLSRREPPTLSSSPDLDGPAAHLRKAW